MAESLVKLKGRVSGLAPCSNDQITVFVALAAGGNFKFDAPLTGLESWVAMIQKRAQLEITISEAP